MYRCEQMISAEDWPKARKPIHLIESPVRFFFLCAVKQRNVRISLTTRAEKPITTLHREPLGAIARACWVVTSCGIG